jgi:hypothetical protein
MTAASFYDFAEGDRSDDRTVTLVRVPVPRHELRRLHGWGRLDRSPARRWLRPSGQAEHRGWLDHLYRLKRADGHVTFRAEPYRLYEEDLDDLNLLRADGWSVELGGYGCHYPTTIVISIRRLNADERSLGELARSTPVRIHVPPHEAAEEAGR